MSTYALMSGVPFKLFDANGGAAVLNSSSVAVPHPKAGNRRITWNARYSATPTTVTIVLQGSMDDTNWFTLDTTTSTAGEVRSIETTVPFIRASLTVKTGSFNTTVEVSI